MKAHEIFAKYPNQYGSDDVYAARKWLETVKQQPANGVFASFSKGKLQGEITSGACHGNISYVAREGSLIASLTKGPTNPGYGQASLVKSDPELAKRWFTWLLNDTYWSPFYVDTTVDEAMCSGLLVPSTLPANLMQGCNILTRHNHEHPNSIRAWDVLINAGMEPDIAYLVVFCWGLTSQSFEQNIPTNVTQFGHNAMGQLTPSVLRNFLDRNYNNLLPPMFKNREGVSYGLSSVIPLNEHEKPQTSYYYGAATAPKHITNVVKFLNSFNKKEKTSSVVSPFAKRSIYDYSLINGMPRPGAKIILDNAKSVQEWLLKEFING